MTRQQMVSIGSLRFMCPEIDATSDYCCKHRFGIRRAFLMLSQAEKYLEDLWQR